VRFVAARCNVHDVLPFHPSDLGIVKGIPAGAYVLKAIVMSRVHRATTVDDHATEIVPAILWWDTARWSQVMVHAESRCEADCLRTLADPARHWIESTLVKTDSQTSRKGHEAGPTLMRWGPRRAGLTPSKVDSQEILNRGLRVQCTRQSEDPNSSHVLLISIQRVSALVSQSTMPRPLCSASKVGRERVKECPEEHRGILRTEDAKVTLDEVV